MSDIAIDRWNRHCLLMKEWLSGTPALQKAEESALHHLLDAQQTNTLLAPPHKNPQNPRADGIFGSDSQVFVFQHDWARAFEGSPEFASSKFLEWDCVLPYPKCCFEFQISGMRILFGTLLEGTNYRMAARIRSSAGWTIFSATNARPEQMATFDLMYRQIRAAVIALDAGVAESELVRAPSKLNKARIARGALPLLDFHVVNLARRSRPPEVADSGESGRGVRLHFRRGHWRHFEQSKTWIKWTLVGDPDLGFIDKHYRL